MTPPQRHRRGSGRSCQALDGFADRRPHGFVGVIAGLEVVGQALLDGGADKSGEHGGGQRVEFPRSAVFQRVAERSGVGGLGRLRRQVVLVDLVSGQRHPDKFDVSPEPVHSVLKVAVHLQAARVVVADVQHHRSPVVEPVGGLGERGERAEPAAAMNGTP